MKIPARLAWSAERWPHPGFKQWVDALPQLVADLERRWSVEIGEAYSPGGYTGFVAPAGPDLVVKIAFPWEPIRAEFDALRAWDGDGAVRIMDGEHFTFLMERCVPGHDLPDELGEDVAVELFRALWRRAPDGIAWKRLADVATEFAGEIGPRAGTHPPDVVPPGAIDHVVAFMRAQATAPQPDILLHGDVHGENVLASQRGWLAIDPSPVVGDPAYDVAMQVIGRVGEILDATDPDAAMSDRLDRLASKTDVDRRLLAEWALARALYVSLHPAFEGELWTMRQRGLIGPLWECAR